MSRIILILVVPMSQYDVHGLLLVGRASRVFSTLLLSRIYGVEFSVWGTRIVINSQASGTMARQKAGVEADDAQPCHVMLAAHNPTPRLASNVIGGKSE